MFQGNAYKSRDVMADRKGKKNQCSWNKEQHSMAADERARAGGKT